MPKLIVYVKAETWRRVEAGYGADAASLLRGVSVEAIEHFVGGLTEGEGLQGSASASRRLRVRPEPTASPSVSPDDHFKPDFGKKLS